MNKTINLNADMGESFGAYSMGNDEALFNSINSANIACGFHAGDPVVMQNTVARAITHKVSLGAHPAFPDLQGFGRRPMKLTDQEVYAAMVYQIGALSGVAKSQGAMVTHVKPHGALNNMACEDAALSAVICKAIRDVDLNLIILAPALSELSSEGKKAGLTVAEEIFADRAYTESGTLVNRQEKGAVIHDADQCLDRILNMLEAGGIITQKGTLLPTRIDSVCVHGDTPGACDVAHYIQQGFAEKGLELLPLDRMSL